MPEDPKTTRDVRRCTRIRQAYEELSTAIRSLSGLSFKVVAVRCVSAYYRGTKVYPFIPLDVVKREEPSAAITLLKPKKPTPALCPSVKVVLTVEDERKWPEEMMAEIKAALCFELSKILKKARRAWLVHPLGESSVVVLLKGIAFSLLLLNRRETDIAMADPPTAAQRRMLVKIRIASQLHSLSTQAPCFGGACRLARLWLGRCMLSKMLEGMVLELMVAHAFVSPDVSTPLTAIAGFAAFLRLFAEHDFLGQPLIIDINKRYSSEESALLLAKFVRMRPTMPLLTLFIPEDASGGLFTQRGPEPVILKRLIRLASEEYTKLCLNSSSLNNQVTSILEDIPHDYTPYDIVIRLRRKHLSAPLAVESTHASNGKVEKLPRVRKAAMLPRSLPVIDFNPVKLLVKEFRDHYGSTAIFFYDEHKSDCIGVVLRPDYGAGKHNRPSARGEHPESDRHRANIPVLVEDFRIIGCGLIRDVQLAKHLSVE